MIGAYICVYVCDVCLNKVSFVGYTLNFTLRPPRYIELRNEIINNCSIPVVAGWNTTIFRMNKLNKS